MTHEDWKTFAAVISGIAQVTAAVAAGVFFAVKWWRGWHITNLALSVTCERTRSTDAGYDWLAVRVVLKKLDRNALTLHDAQARVTSDSGKSEHGMISFWGMDRFAQDASGADGHCRAVWGKVDAEYPRLNLTPGEETQLAGVVRVPSGVPCQVDVVVLGEHFGEGIGCGQWKASAVSLPIAEPPPSLSDSNKNKAAGPQVVD